MYPTEYTWISDPTPVISSTKHTDSWSSWRPKSTCSWATGTQENSVSWIVLSSALRPSRSANDSAPTTNDAIAVAHPSR